MTLLDRGQEIADFAHQSNRTKQTHPKIEI